MDDIQPPVESSKTGPARAAGKGGRTHFIYGVLIVLLLVLIGGGFIHFSRTVAELEELHQGALSKIESLEEKEDALEREVGLLSDANHNLQEELAERRRIINSLSGELEDREGELDRIRRVQAVDPELLKKYSKVYFLNENYEPRSLITIPEEYRAREDEEEFFLEDAWPFLEELLKASRADGVELTVLSAYRSFGEQAELKERYTVIYGEHTANQFSATQGYSEHQLGTAVDFSTAAMDGSLSGFENTDEYRWLKENAHRFGFVLSYPEGNPSYIFEPWHWRFVGVELATDLHVEGKYFYDMDQRRIDQYRPLLFER